MLGCCLVIGRSSAAIGVVEVVLAHWCVGKDSVKQGQREHSAVSTVKAAEMLEDFEETSKSHRACWSFRWSGAAARNSG